MVDFLSAKLRHSPPVRGYPFPLPTTQALILRALASAEDALTGTDIDTSGLSSAISSSDALTPGSTANSLAVTTAGNALSAVQIKIDLEFEILLDSLQGSSTTPDAAASFATVVGCSASLANTTVAKIVPWSDLCQP